LKPTAIFIVITIFIPSRTFKQVASRMAVSDYFSVKYGALALLVLQNTLLVICMRYSRVSEGPMYAASTAVFCMEAIKFVCCNGVVLFQSGSFGEYAAELYKECTITEILKLSVPSFLYTVQNNLLYFALSNLDATTYQVCYQTKILTTAVFSSFMLGKSLSLMQWMSLLVLTIGVSIAQLSSSEVSDSVHSLRLLYNYSSSYIHLRILYVVAPRGLRRGSGY
jgi:UDP-sugar transporter A1/2/3